MKIPLHLLAAVFAGFLSTSARAADDLQDLQGRWEGYAAGDKPGAKVADLGNIFKDTGKPSVAAHKPQEKVTVTIKGDSFHFHRDSNFWFETTITLPPGTAPRQLLASIKSAAPSQGEAPVGKLVTAIYKIEDGVLTLAGGGSEGAPKSFAAVDDGSLSVYELRKVQPEKQDAEPPKPN